MLALLLMAVSGALAGTVTVTWKSSDIKSGSTFTKDGVTGTGTVNKNQFANVTFTTTRGKFTKIEVSAMVFNGGSGTGWSKVSDSNKTWQGTPSSTVTFGGTAYYLSQIVFTIEEPILVTEVTLNKTEAQLILGETLTLTATVTPDNAGNKTVTWTTSDASVATVANGTVTTVGAGTATITATATNGTADTSDDKTATCAVTVTVNHKTILTDDKVDTDNWSFTPAEVAATGVEVGTQVSFGYNGRLKIKSLTVRTGTVASNADAEATGNVVACIGTTTYAKLEEAGMAVASGQTIKLLADVQRGDELTIYAGRDVTFDLNGHTFTNHPWEISVLAVGAGAKITIIDSSTDTPGGVIGFVLGYNGGKVVLANGRYNMNRFDAELLQENLAEINWEIPADCTLEDVFNAPDAQEFYVCVEPPASGIPVDDFTWDAATKQGTYTMPEDNVKVKVKYYTQASAADGAVTAASHVMAEDDDPLVIIDETKLKGASAMMYLVTNTVTKPDYSDSGWSTTLPTANTYTEGCTVYVWYYPVGQDNGDKSYSDGNMCAQPVEVVIEPQPLFVVAFADGTDTSLWTPESVTDVKRGTEITVNYTGKRRVDWVEVKQKKPILVEEIKLNKTNTYLNYWSTTLTETLSATVYPDNAKNKTVVWSSDNEEVATVNATTGEITAIAPGTATITATSTDGTDLTASCAVTVYYYHLPTPGRKATNYMELGENAPTHSGTIYFKGKVTTSSTSNKIAYYHGTAGSYDTLFFNGNQFYRAGWNVPGALDITGGTGTESDPYVLSTP